MNLDFSTIIGVIIPSTARMITAYIGFQKYRDDQDKLIKFLVIYKIKLIIKFKFNSKLGHIYLR